MLRDEFLSLAAHEFRTPVTVIKAQAQLAQKFLEKGQFSEELAAQALKTFVREADRLSRLCSHLLLLSKLDSGSLEFCPQTVELNAAVERTLKRMNSELELYQIEFITSGPVEVCADLEWTEQVLENLLGNTIRWSPRGSRIQIRLATDQDEAIVAIRDESVRIPNAEIEKIFDRYFQVHQSGLKGPGGLGTSLYLCRELVHRMNGRMTATNDEVAEFVFALPRAR